MVFGKENKSIPEGIETSCFLIRPLRATDVELDYAAVMESKAFLRKWDQSSWPTDDFTLADNLEDLQRHEGEHIRGESFTFTVMNPDETVCLGCVYIFPLTARWLTGAQAVSAGDAAWNDYEAIVMFWIRQSRLAEGLDRRFLDVLRPWFRDDWTFDGHLFLTHEQFAQQVDMMEAAGMTLQMEVALPNHRGLYRAYG